MCKQEMETKTRERDMFDIRKIALAEAVEVTAEAVTSGYKKIESGVVGGYKKIEEGAVKGFGKVVDKCVEVLFAKEGESVEDAKRRLTGEDQK